MLRGSYDEDKSSGSVASAESRLRCEAEIHSHNCKDICLRLYDLNIHALSAWTQINFYNR